LAGRRFLIGHGRAWIGRHKSASLREWRARALHQQEEDAHAQPPSCFSVLLLRCDSPPHSSLRRPLSASVSLLPLSIIRLASHSRASLGRTIPFFAIHTFNMRTSTIIAPLFLAATTLAQDVEEGIAPSAPAPSGCEPNANGNFTIGTLKVQHASKSKRESAVEVRHHNTTPIFVYRPPTPP
jgi:hypothetical protein